MDSSEAPSNLGICVIGLGWGHKYHARHYAEMDTVDL